MSTLTIKFTLRAVFNDNGEVFVQKHFLYKRQKLFIYSTDKGVYSDSLCTCKGV